MRTEPDELPEPEEDPEPEEGDTGDQEPPGDADAVYPLTCPWQSWSSRASQI